MGKQLCIVYHSQSGRSEQLAFAFYTAAKVVDTVHSVLLKAEEATVDDLLVSDAWVFLCAENFADISGGMKNFFDRVYYPFERANTEIRKEGVPYMLILSAGNDGSFCEQKLTRILSGLNAKKVQESRIFYGEPDAVSLEEVGCIGEAFATALDMGAF